MNKLKVIFYIFVFSFLFPIKTFALTPLVDPIKSKVQVQWDKIFQNACTNKKNRIQARVDKFIEHKNSHLEIYAKLEDRLSQKIEDWKNMGYDVTQLEEDFIELQVKVQNYLDDFATYFQKLSDLKDIACEDADTYKAGVDETKALIAIVREDTRSIRQFYQNTIRPHILELKDQNPSSEGEL